MSLGRKKGGVAADINVTPLIGLGDKIVGAVIVIKDTSETQQIELELETRVARLVSLGVELEQL
ncbi:MAG TPA: hypothetical protein VGF94_26990, partial [Kofleriaceae bacterium]